MLCAEKKVSEQSVLSVPEVLGTETWKPVHHGLVIETMADVCEQVGLEVINRQYSLRAEGSKMFGVWAVKSADQEMAYSIGFRNSMDKSMSLGITAGTFVFVCENMAFSGEMVTFRRHTKNIEVELPELMLNAMEIICTKMESFMVWHKRMRAYVLRKTQAELLTVRAMKEGALPPSKFNRFYSAFFDERAPYGKRPDLYSWHEAVTEVFRDSSLFDINKKNKVLNLICDEYMSRYDKGLLAA